MSMTTDELKALAESLLVHLEPAIVATAKAAAGMISGVAAPIVQTSIDTVDALVRAHNPSIALADPVNSAPTPVAVPEDAMAALAARVSALEVHVAALTTVTGAATSASFVTTKATMNAPKPVTVN